MIGNLYLVIKPGTFLDMPDKEKAFEINALLMEIDRVLLEANIALNLFNEAVEKSSKRVSKEKIEENMELRASIAREVAKDYKEPHTRINMKEISFISEVKFVEKQWKSGVVPSRYETGTVFLYAKVFLSALDGFNKLIGVLSTNECCPKEVIVLHQNFKDIFPNLQMVRNSEQHREDRVRGLGAYNKPLNLKPIDGNFIKSQGGVLALGCLNGTKYGNTMADGHYGEVDVSESSMRKMVNIYQSILETFEWSGSKQCFPWGGI